MIPADPSPAVPDMPNYKRLHRAALWVLQGQPSDHAAECAALALEVCATLDALTAAAKPIEEAVQEDDADWQRHEGGRRASYYTLDAATVRALMDCITTLIRGSNGTD